MIERFEQFSSVVYCLYRDLVKIERAEMEKYGLRGIHGICLMAMLRYPEGITSAELCQVCDKDKAAVSRTVADLEQRKLVRRRDPEGIRYRSRLSLTEEGCAAAQALQKRTLRAVIQAGAGVSEEKRQTFYEVMDQIAGNLNTICKDGIQ